MGQYVCFSYEPISLLPSSTVFCVLFAVKSRAAGNPIESKRISLQKMAIRWVHGYKKGSQKYLTHLLYPSIIWIRCCFEINICQWVCWWLIDSWWRLRNYRLFHPTGWTQLTGGCHQTHNKALNLKAMSYSILNDTLWFTGISTTGGPYLSIFHNPKKQRAVYPAKLPQTTRFLHLSTKERTTSQTKWLAKQPTSQRTHSHPTTKKGWLSNKIGCSLKYESRSRFSNFGDPSPVDPKFAQFLHPNYLSRHIPGHKKIKFHCNSAFSRKQDRGALKRCIG